MPTARMRSTSCCMVQPSFFPVTNQSPSAHRSLSRAPNQPSSSTNSSMSSFDAAVAMLSSFSASKSI